MQFDLLTECVTHAQEFEDNITAFTLAFGHQLLAFTNTLVIEEIAPDTTSAVETHIIPHCIKLVYVVETDYRNATSKVNHCPVVNVPQHQLDVYLSLEERRGTLQFDCSDHAATSVSASELATGAAF